MLHVISRLFGVKVEVDSLSSVIHRGALKPEVYSIALLSFANIADSRRASSWAQYTIIYIVPLLLQLRLDY
jgi:hypothetical protein